MSYARWGDDSDVYIYGNPESFFVCQECQLMPIEPVAARDYKGNPIPDKFVDVHNDFMASTAEEMLRHIARHREAGHKVPMYADEQLQAQGAG